MYADGTAAISQALLAAVVFWWWPAKEGSFAIVSDGGNGLGAAHSLAP